MKNQQSWSIIIFCYNEAGTIVSVINAAQDFFKKISCTDYEIIVVDDGSSDGSKELIQNAQHIFSNLKIILHIKNSGIGAALRSGYNNATKENVVAIPADGQFDVNELIPFANVDENTFISFFRKENTIYSFRRNIFSYLNKMLNSLFLGIRLKDVNWVKIYKQKDISVLNLKLKSSLVESEICSKLLLNGKNVIEVQSVYLQRKFGVSKGASLKTVIQAAKETLKLAAVIASYRMSRKNIELSM